MPEPVRTLVITATYNEIENLPALVDEIFRHAPQVDLLVIDDNSPDGTGQWCQRHAQQEPRLRCLHRAGKLGLGSAIVEGLRYGIEHGYTYVVNVDADFSHHPRYLPAMLDAMQPAGGEAVDVAIGSRYVPGGGTENWPLRRKLMSRLVNLYARWLLWLSPRDCSGGYRCYRASKVAQLDTGRFLSSGYSFQEEMLWRLRRRGARFTEVPIVFTDRARGQSKINLREALHALWIIFALGVRGLLPEGRTSRCGRQS